MRNFVLKNIKSSEIFMIFDLDSKEGGKDQLIERCVTFLMKPTATNMTTIEALDKSRKSKTVLGY